MRLVMLFSLLLYLLPSVSQGTVLTIGPDIPYLYVEDPEGHMTLEQFLALPRQALEEANRSRSWGYTRSTYWVRFELPAALFHAQERWLELGPNFVDHITLYHRLQGSADPWTRRESGDLAPYESRDLDYRFPVFKLAEITDGSAGHEVVIRLRSTSALLLDATLWEPEAFTEQALGNSLFWSFYLSLAAISSALALLLALVLRNRMFWSVCAFSLSYLLVACIQGYLGWLWGTPGLHLQHYLTSILVLYNFACLVWMCTEVFNLERYLPRLYRLMIGVALLIAALLLGIPLDLYGEAVRLQVLISLASSPVLVGCALYLRWRNCISWLEMLVGLGPLLYVLAGVIAALIMNGLIDHDPRLYALWEYLLMGNMLLVLAVAILRVRDEQRRARKARQEARDWRVERAASFHQRQFIGMVSHEFRTPLAVISAALENLSLLSTPEDPRHGRYEKIKRATTRLMTLTDNCLADARLSSSTLYLDKRRTDLLTLLHDAASVVVISDQHRLRVRVNGEVVDPAADPRPELALLADGGLLSVALSNLLDNAVKYSRGGLISVDIQFSGGDCRLQISDQGPGIAPELAEQVFDRYRRAAVPGREIRGCGLGLHVARQIARAHQGDLRLMDTQGAGSCFLLSLPCQGSRP